MFNSQKLEAITTSTLIVGVDIAKKLQWARFTDYRGLELGKVFKFRNDKNGFETILASIRTICKLKKLNKVIVGMEPTGHYFKPLANYLILNKITVVMVNPYHTKRAKELDDNSPTKSDKKDALTIARLVRDGRYYEVYMPHDIFAELRVLSNTRISLMKRHNALMNTITTVLDEYFPEADTGMKETILSIPGIGTVIAASFLGEIGDPLRFDHPRQISKMAGYNLVENSSGKNISGTSISKRGRKNLRNVLYQMARTMVAVNAEMKELYQYLKMRPQNSLKKKQALVVISKKIVTVIYNLVKKQTAYKAELVLGEFRRKQMQQAA